MTKINTALATTGIVASMANGAPLNGGSQVEANTGGITKADWFSIHPDREPYAVATGFPVSRFPGGPRKGPCGKECDTQTASSVVDDEVSTTKVVIDPLNPTRPMGTPATTYTNIFTVSEETGKATTTAAQTQTASSESIIRLPPASASEIQRTSVPNIVFVTTGFGFETSVTKTSEAGAMPTLINPLLPPWDQPQPILSSVSVPEPVLTTIIPKTTSTIVPNMVLTTIHETTSTTTPNMVLITIHETTSSGLPEPVLTTIHETTSSGLPEPVLTTIHESTTSHTNSTQTQTPTETAVEVATEFETVLATATQYVTPAPVEQTFTTVTTTREEKDVHTGRRA
ncbi:hypothetical protein CkaCkLH20_08201 [Colletotrichum karsti]|uniref:Uncharacterized protein n=1 Tax=Colletotrichum karsti TaxID=1095194 RepID=A0A9P6I0I0_9PEZI|nr:uncharacterized protein CkaCkLH20_08201 [Colletotrichum karsti]KAF9874218.1 hypothetical protein CkaCkLH20_08201 [Colletotrichum karsti]